MGMEISRVRLKSGVSLWRSCVSYFNLRLLVAPFETAHAASRSGQLGQREDKKSLLELAEIVTTEVVPLIRNVDPEAAMAAD